MKAYFISILLQLAFKSSSMFNWTFLMSATKETCGINSPFTVKVDFDALISPKHIFILILCDFIAKSIFVSVSSHVSWMKMHSYIFPWKDVPWESSAHRCTIFLVYLCLVTQYNFLVLYYIYHRVSRPMNQVWSVQLVL